jgi:hypothetical protein
MVGEGGPRADRHPPATHALVDAQHVHLRVDRVLVAARVLLGGALAVAQDHAVVGEVRLQAAVLREAEDPRRAPAGARRPEVVVRPRYRGRDLVVQEAVELRVGGRGVHERVERERIGRGLHARRRRVQRREVGVAARAGVRVRGRDQDVLLGEAAVGERLADLLEHPARDHEQVDLDEGDLAPVALEHHRARVEPRVLAVRRAVRARPAA